jgi:hypothetical protein
MPVSIQWDNAEKTVIMQQYEGDVTVEEYLHAIHHTAQMLLSVPQQQIVHLIYDRTRVTSTPQPMSRVFQVASKALPPNLGMKVLVGATLTTTINLQLCKVIAPNLARQVVFAETVQQARAMIDAHTGTQARV